MAPGRKRGANKTKTSSELGLGDLVLAKVKGFPAWPAKVSRPEDWDRTPDPKKYFVQFFGTQEIAFVAPADVQAFTSESKSRLLARCKGKTVKYFTQAVKEICEAFEHLQQNGLDGSSKYTDAADPQSYAFDGGRGEVQGSHAEISKGDEMEGVNGSNVRFDPTQLLGDCSGMGEMLCHKRGKQAEIAEESSDPDCQVFKTSIKDGTLRESGASVHSPLTSLIKEETNSTENKTERVQSSRASSASPYSCRVDVGLDVNHRKAGKKDGSLSLEASGYVKVPVAGSKKATNGQRSKDATVGSKRKLDDGKSSGHVMDRVPDKVTFGANGKQLSPGAANSSGKAVKKQIKGERHLDLGKNLPKDTTAYPKDRGDGDISKQKSGAIGQEQSHLAKKAKHVDMINEAAKTSVFRNVKNDLESGTGGDEAVLSVAKHRLRAVESMSDVSVPSEDKKVSVASGFKNDLPKKRRAVRLYDDEDEEPKTPVHGGSLSASKARATVIPESTRNTEENHDVSNSHVEKSLKGSGGNAIVSKIDCPSSAILVSEASVADGSLAKIDGSVKPQAFHSPKTEVLDHNRLKDTRDLISPSKSPILPSANKLLDQQKGSRASIKASSATTPTKAHSGSSKGPNLVSGASHSSQSQVSGRKSRQSLSGDRPKVTLKLSMRNEPADFVDGQKDQYSMEGGRLEASGSVLDPKAGESSFSMKHLIAAAQAKRREAQVQNVPHGNGNSASAPANILRGRSPSPSTDQAVLKSNLENLTQLDPLGVQSRGYASSPSGHVLHLASQNQLDSDEGEEKGVNTMHQAAGSSLSGGTEAAVARDAFEGMIETLSRTKDSIGRATRLAIDCAKYGIANEVVELLICKLENESSFHRKVDLFFLVDSITQCSHSQKGIAGASYIPIVQAALPRLLGAAAPSGASARENRRQCLKVLRLWLERKIFQESVLRRYMDDIGGSNDDLGGGLSLRRPSRAERSVDDPIREMEGMLVDEYGSNATFNLPGFLQSRGFVDEEDEDDVPTTPCKESPPSPSEFLNASVGPEIDKVTPSDRPHHILEDVDGELEMEDVSGHVKDGDLSPRVSLKKEKQEKPYDIELVSYTNNVVELPSPEGSPPLPLEPPPPLPPLPCSPPPPLPPVLAPSPPPPPPPPASLTSQPPPPPSLTPQPPPPPSLTPQLPPPSSLASQPPPPPLLASQSLPPPLLPSGPPNPNNFQPMLSHQPSPQVLPQPSSVHSQVQAPLPPDYSIPTGSQSVQIAGNTLQQVSCFAPSGAPVSRDPSGYSSRPLEYGQSDIYPGPQAVQPNRQYQHNQQFQPCQTPFGHGQRPFPPIPVPQPASNNFSYNKPPVQQHMPHPHPHPHPHPPPPPPPSHVFSSVSQAQWRSGSAEFKVENQHNAWVNGGRTPACLNATFVGEAYFRPLERPPPNNMGYQISAPNPALGGPSTVGHSINQMLPSRPDMSSLNSWRPV